MVGKVHLQRHHRLRQRRYSLIGGDELSDTERDALQQLCRQGRVPWSGVNPEACDLIAAL
jgi:hypothetical protein